MGKKIEPINLSHMEKASECKLGQKVKVYLPGQADPIALDDVTFAGGNKDRYISYDQFQDGKGLIFSGNTCPCTGDSKIRWFVKIEGSKDFEQLRDILSHSVWMEQSVCYQFLRPAPSAPEPKVPVEQEAESQETWDEDYWTEGDWIEGEENTGDGEVGFAPLVGTVIQDLTEGVLFGGGALSKLQEKANVIGFKGYFSQLFVGAPSALGAAANDPEIQNQKVGDTGQMPVEAATEEEGEGFP